MMHKKSVAVVSFSQPVIYPAKPEGEKESAAHHNQLVSLLRQQNLCVFSPLENTQPSPRFGVSSTEQALSCAKQIKAQEVHCLIFCVDQWTSPTYAQLLVRELGLPTAIVAYCGPEWPGETTSAAIAGSIMENDPVFIERFKDGDTSSLLKWIDGVSTAVQLKKSTIVLFGGDFGAEIAFTRDDLSLMERMFVRQFKVIDEILLHQRATHILATQPNRVEGFIGWLVQQGVAITLDDEMLTQQALHLQVAQYLAARELLKEIPDVSAASVKCHYCVSMIYPGCTECMLPAFLPLAQDGEGEQKAVPVACEGDVKGTVTMAMLWLLNRDCPPLFGDVIYSGKDEFVLRNCGAHSAFWNSLSQDPASCLKGIEIIAQNHGASGGAVKFIAKATPVTIARLFKHKGQYCLYLGLSEILEEGFNQSLHSGNWPQATLRNPVGSDLFFKTLPCNHLTFTIGNRVKELEYLCHQLAIRVVRCDQAEALIQFREGID